MWRLNKQFIEDQFSKGKIFYFSHNPIAPKGESYPKEIQLLKDLVLKNTIKQPILLALANYGGYHGNKIQSKWQRAK